MTNKLPVKTLEDVRALNPCYDPSRFAPEDWRGTALDVLKAEQIPAADRLWVVCNEGWIPEREARLFAVWCAREALALVKNPDPRSVEACEVAERYANGAATDAELAAARAAARAAAWDAARAAAWAAAWAVAWAVAWDAARAAAWAAARAAAWDAAQAAQCRQLADMLEEYERGGEKLYAALVIQRSAFVGETHRTIEEVDAVMARFREWRGGGE